MNAAHSLNFALLLQRKRTLLLTGAAVAASAFMVSKVLPLQYTSEGGMVVETPVGINPSAAADEGTSVVQTQIDVLQSKGLLAGVVRDLKLRPEDVVPKLRLPPRARDEIASVAQSLKDAARSLNDSGHAPPADPAEQTVDYIQKHLVIAAKPGSKLISLRFWSGSATMSALIINAVMNNYLNSDTKVQDDRIGKVSDYITAQEQILRTRVDEAQERLTQFTSRHSVPEIQGGTSAALLLSRNEEALAVARQQLVLRQAALDTLQRNGVEGSEEAITSPTVQGLKLYKAQVSQQLSTYGSNDPRRLQLEQSLRSIGGQIDRELTLIREMIERNVKIAQAKVSTLEAAVSREADRSQDMSNAAVAIRLLTADVDLKRQALLAFQTQAAQLRSAAEQAPTAHVLYQAVAPMRPVNTYTMISLLLGFVSGIAGASATILFRDAFGTRVSSTFELETITRVPAFGSLPDLKQLRSGAIVAKRREVVSVVNETFRSLCFTMRPQGEQHDGGTVAVITSSEVGEGKSLTAAAIAQRFAEDGFRVLLIDADLRRPRLHKLLGVKAVRSLEAVVNRDVALANAVHRVESFGYDCLLSNGQSRNPARVIGSDAFQALLTEARAHYEFVLLDSPPVMHVVDPVLLAKLCDYILFIVKSEQIPGDVIREATRRFPEVERNRMMTLLTQVKPGKLDRRDYYSGYDSENFELIGHDK